MVACQNPRPLILVFWEKLFSWIPSLLWWRISRRRVKKMRKAYTVAYTPGVAQNTNHRKAYTLAYSCVYPRRSTTLNEKAIKKCFGRRPYSI